MLLAGGGLAVNLCSKRLAILHGTGSAGSQSMQIVPWRLCFSLKRVQPVAVAITFGPARCGGLLRSLTLHAAGRGRDPAPALQLLI